MVTTEFFTTPAGQSAGVTIAQLQDSVRQMRFRKSLRDICDRADTADYSQIIGNMVERIERANDPRRRRYVWDMRERLAFRGMDLLEAQAVRS